MTAVESASSGAHSAEGWVKRFARGESFYPLFVLLLVSLAFIIGGGDRRWAVTVGHVLAAASLLLAVRPARASRVWSVLGWVALALGAASALVQAFTDARILRVILSLVFLVVLFSSLPLILRRLLSHREVTAETIVGALCAYLLIGMDFAVLGVLISAIAGEPIIASTANPGVAITRGDFYYQSFITLTTVGYGDFVPARGAARTLAILEGILGQLFLVTVVARLVSVATFRRSQAGSADAAAADADEEDRTR